MIFTECTCGETYTSGYECGDPMGYARIDCKCGKMVMIELSSIGETTILDSEEELDKFIQNKGLIHPNDLKLKEGL